MPENAKEASYVIDMLRYFRVVQALAGLVAKNFYAIDCKR